MTMHLIRGATSLNTKKRKTKNKTKRLIEAEAEHERFLTRMGVKGNGVSKYHRNEIPDYRTGPQMTSDKIAGNGTKKDAIKYTGDEIAGLVTMHKSNTVPIRKDNKQAAVDAARMRRS